MRLVKRIGYWMRRREHATAVAEEMAFHREMIERSLIERGMPPAEARDAARRAMGNETYMREESRHVWLWPAFEAAWQDATHSLRSLRRTPAFAIGVMLTLGLGIGANAAMFSLVDRLLFRPPARMIDPSSVNRVSLYRTFRGEEQEGGSGMYARYVDLATYATRESEVATFVRRNFAIGVGQDTRLRNTGVVSANFFGFFDAPPVIGRYFTPTEDSRPQLARVAVLSYDAWQTDFGGRTNVLGAVVQIDAAKYTIIGVAPKGFVGLWPFLPPAVYIPVSTYASTRPPRNWATTYTTMIGLDILVRRKPGVSVDGASADLTNALRRSYLKQDADANIAPLNDLRPRALAGSVLLERGPRASGTTPTAKWLSGVTLIVLLIACANVVNLVLARSIRRRRETAVRVALGVSRRRLLAQLLTEGMLLAGLGFAAGIVVALWVSGVLSTTFLPGTERQSLLGDSRTLAFAALITIAAGVAAGLAPLALIRGGNLTGDLKSGTREGGHQRKALRTSLLLVQSALSVVLLIGAGLFVESLRNVRNVHIGFDADSVLDVSLNMRDVRLDSTGAVALRLRLLAAASRVPGVTHATLQESTPFNGSSSWPVFVAGIDSTQLLGQFDLNAVSADYFATMGTRILRGRGISSIDVDGAPRAAVVGQSMANVLWPGQDPIGKCMRVGLVDTVPCTYVVGVAEDIHSQSIEPELKLFYYYLSAAQWRPQIGGLFVRARDTDRLIEPLRKQLQQEMPGTSYVTVKRLGDFVDATMRSWIVGATVFTAFGLLALVLAAVGLYSVIAYDVSQRKHELGVRIALGAGQSRVVRLVVLQGVRVTFAGVVIGITIALAAGRWIGPMLFGVAPSDARVYGLVIVTMLGVAAVASVIPAARAAMLDPKAALQAD